MLLVVYPSVRLIFGTVSDVFGVLEISESDAALLLRFKNIQVPSPPRFLDSEVVQVTIRNLVDFPQICDIYLTVCTLGRHYLSTVREQYPGKWWFQKVEYIEKMSY